MARVTGPLFSQSASGQFAGALVYAQRLGQSVVRALVIPSNPNTLLQQAVRLGLSVTGIITRRVSIANLGLATESLNIRDFYRSRTRGAEVWNSALVREMTGPGRATYLAGFAQWEALASNFQTLWTNAAGIAPVLLPPVTRDGTTIDAGFLLFQLQRTISESGYGTFDEEVPQVLTDEG